jgi:uncharacterized SAM-binding protein YcdF (DUF218 family)
MRVLQGTGGDQPRAARLVGTLRAALLPARTRLMLLLGLFGAGAVAAVQLYPAPVAVLFCLLMAATCTLPLRVPALPSLLVAALSTAALAVGRLASMLLQANPGVDGTGSTTAPAPLAAALTDVSARPGLLLGAVILACSSLLALSLSRALARPVRAPSSRRGESDSRPAVLSLDSGLTKAEWELARAAHYRRQVTLCLVGLDRPQGEEEPPAQESVMLRVDQFLVGQLSRFEAVAEHRPGERLLLLPEVWADGFVEEAERLCHLAGQRAGRPVRAALVTFPFHGTRAGDLLSELELALERSRSGNLLVSVGVVAPDSSPATGFAS